MGVGLDVFDAFDIDAWSQWNRDLLKKLYVSCVLSCKQRPRTTEGHPLPHRADLLAIKFSLTGAEL